MVIDLEARQGNKGQAMNDEIKKYYESILLGQIHPIMDEKGKIHHIYLQPERLNPEDVNCVYDSLNSDNKKNPRDIQK